MTGSFRAYAEHRGVSVQAVSNAVEDGRIAAALTGETKGRIRFIDFEKADQLWPVNKPEPETPEAKESLSAALLREAIADADLKEHKVAVQRGLYWLKDDVLRRGRIHAGLISSAREALPSQLAPQLVGKTDLGEIERILRNALRDCDKRVADEILARFGPDGDEPEPGV